MNHHSGRSVVVCINDRAPFVKDASSIYVSPPRVIGVGRLARVSLGLN
jgi:rare lipoprotein A (peptidoglycan hydrolase)